MASFPTSVKTFTSKSAGQTVASAHMNDVQDEVNAIEAGYLQGSARLNSSHSTLAALSVAGGSTFTSRPLMPPPEMALVYLESTGAVASSALSTVAWNAQSFVGNSSMHSTGTNPQRLIPQTTGMFQAICQVLFTANANLSARNVAIDDSSGGQIAVARVSSNSDTPYLTVIGYKRFDQVGGYLTARLQFAGGSTVSVSTGVGNTWFALQKL
jgi:hypothetical protein